MTTVWLILLTVTVVTWEGLLNNDIPVHAGLQHIASMAGDSETHPRSGDENTDIIRQPFLIGVSGGTASGKVCTMSCCFGDFLQLSKLDFVSALTVNYHRGSTGCWLTAWLQRGSVIDSSIICLTIHPFGRNLAGCPPHVSQLPLRVFDRPLPFLGRMGVLSRSGPTNFRLWLR